MTRSETSITQSRSKILFFLILLGLVAIQARLFYWQIIKGQSLRIQAKNQIIENKKIIGERGRIFAADGHLLVGNKNVFDLFINKKELEIDELDLLNQLAEILSKQELEGEEAEEVSEQVIQNLVDRLDSESNWIKLASALEPNVKEEITNLDLTGLYLENNSVRYYPEASMAAHLTGFVGKDTQGEPTGYFGIEGALEHELGGNERKISFLHDALGQKMADQELSFSNLDGRDITLTISRQIQHLANTHLQKGIEKYQAKSGEIVIMNPENGNLLALATWPHYSPENYGQYHTELYKNPSLANLFEPGSTFKTLTVSAGIDAGVITPETECSNCSGPRVIGGYTIRTWNDVYHPNITVSDALAKSDNIAMIFIAEAMGANTFKKYLKDFGIGQKIDIDLQEDTDTPFPDRWGPVELATTSFGQGISTNSLQMVRAVSAIANQGTLMRPTIIKKVFDPQTNETIGYQPQKIKQVISEDSARTVIAMMVKAAQKGEAQWIGKKYNVAGKTGTSQVPSPEGGYKEDATIASFIGFAPPEDPKFVMLVKLTEPQSSPWAAETAAPLWFDLAEKLFLFEGIQER
ncbi:MAG: penicillin-binding protein 2 [Patescibacteria group bacterium]|nr:penicillin-binding protein 2 [Patescibacteria group bacterium]